MARFKLVNVVGGGGLGTNIDLYNCVGELSRYGAIYEPEQSPGIQLKLASTGVTAMVFQSGMYHLTGARSTEELQDAGCELIKVIEKNVDISTSPTDIDVRNLVYSGSFDQQIDLENLALDLDGAHYDPTTHNGLVYKKEDWKGTIMIFRTGSYTYTGASDEKQACESLETLHDVVSSLLE